MIHSLLMDQECPSKAQIPRLDLIIRAQTSISKSNERLGVLGGGYVLQEIQPPPRFFGKTIRELDIGRALSVQVVLLRKRAAAGGRPAIRVPTGDDRIDEGDRLVVAGSKAAVESLDVI